jgi:hypothetical protein
MRWIGVTISVAIGASQMACVSASDRRAASIKGACDSFVAPREVVLGKRRVDQKWIDGTIESGVSACNWPRPRKPSLS